MTRTVVVVGAGHAGVQLADSLRAEGFAGRVVIVDPDPNAPYQRPPLSKEFMTGADAEALPLRATSFFASRDIELRLGVAATSIDPANRRLHLSRGEPLMWDHLVLANGAAARVLDVDGATLSGVRALRTLDDARRLRDALGKAERVLVIGAGFIGLEFCAVAVAQGKRVHVVDPMPRALSRSVSGPVAAHLVRRLEEQGVTFSFGTEVRGFEGDARVRSVNTSSGELPTDLVVVGIGIVPRDQLARDAGLAVAGGVVVDGALRTSDPDVFAVGDVAAAPLLGRRMRLECVQNATDQGKYVAARIVGTVTDDYAQVPRFWSHQGSARLQIAGLPSPGCESEIVGDVDSGAFSVRHFADGELVAVESLNQAREHLSARRELESLYVGG